ncbi:hypothetical protein SEA_ZITCH_64 [Gordonia Phage Zitch]|uniref:Uncharacterized protein n=1 Tax=Gordonia Phage Zitch TaxID=2743909 RepID=A0A7G3V995_9CAUD|nr:hypothetical protein J1774_gp64 [Gordonia Phage Zitch]QKY78509.1 hypothetical protein SEA_ZITCH_64 [Gordonia Phage Zitch]
MSRSKLPGRQITRTLRVWAGSRGISVWWKRPDGKWHFRIDRWSPHGAMPPPGCSWKPWPHRQLHRDLEQTFIEIYWPTVGSIHATRFYNTSYVFDYRGDPMSLRDRWVKRAERPKPARAYQLVFYPAADQPDGMRYAVPQLLGDYPTYAAAVRELEFARDRQTRRGYWRIEPTS